MFPRGTIYRYDKYLNHGEVVLEVPFWTKVGYTVARGVGAGLIGFAIISAIFTYGPLVSQEVSYDLLGPKEETPYSVSDFALADATSAVQNEAKSYGVNSYFSIVIPKIGAYQNVIANVDARDEKQYLDALQRGVAHAKGTYFPGQGENIFLFSHSTDSPLNFARYNAVFYLLGKLEKGDRVIIFFADKKYEYEIVDKVRATAKDTSWLTENSVGERLVLQTCDPPGTTWNRLLVIAKPVIVDKNP